MLAEEIVHGGFMTVSDPLWIKAKDEFAVFAARLGKLQEQSGKALVL